MAKPIITDKPIIDQAEFNGVTIWRKEGGSIEISDTNYPSVKAAIRDIAKMAGIPLQDEWNTQYMGWYIIQQLKGIKENSRTLDFTPPTPSNVTIITLDEPGTLEQYFNSKELPLDSTVALSIQGQINEEDSSFIRWHLSPIYLDLQNVQIDEISDFMFDNLFDVETILLPLSVESIGDFAFRNCVRLNYLNIPSGVKEIGDSAFENCTNLNHLSVSPDNQHFKMIQNCLVSQSEPTIILWGHGNTIPTGMSSIEYGEYSCGGYKSLFIPDSFYVSKGGLGIANRESLISVHVNTTHPDYVEKDNSLLNKDESVLLMGTNTSIIPNTVRTIACRAFIGCESLDNISIPESVEIIDEYSFYGCKSLPEITIPGSVKEIKEYAFFECENLKHIVLSEGLVTIGKAAFGGCKNIESIVIPYTVETIDREAFGWCDNLKEVTLLCPMPPHLGEYAFDSDVKVHIPRGTKIQYEPTIWGKFNLDELS